jgi:hypothetical protein
MPRTALALAAALSAVAVLLSGCVYVYVDRGGYYYRSLPLPASPPASYDGGGYSPSPQPWTAPPPTRSPTLRATSV